MPRWAEVVAHFLRPGGRFYIAEAHPFAQVFDDGRAATEPRLRYDYWHSPEPLEFPTEGSYADPTAHVEQPVEYGWQHHMGEVVSSLARAGLRIEFLHEFPFAVWQLYRFLVEVGPHAWRLPAPFDGRLPLTFSLAATKT